MYKRQLEGPGAAATEAPAEQGITPEDRQQMEVGIYYWRRHIALKYRRKLRLCNLFI